MWVKSAELINVKSHECTKIVFSKSVNLLIGANNAGKSTIIKSLLNLQYRTFEAKDIRAEKDYAKTLVEISDIDEKDNKSFYNRKEHEQYEIASAFTVFWNFSKAQQVEEYLFVNSEHQITRLDYDRVEVKDLKGNSVSFKTFPRFPDSENQNNFVYPFLSKRKTEYYDSNISEEQSFKVLEGLRNLAAKIQKIGNASHYRNQEFVSLCDDILGFRIGVIPVTHPNSGGIEPGIYVSGEVMIPLRSMGDGVANIVGFIVTLLTEDHKLYLIEEIENDIHPKALKKLLDLIESKSDKNQFVISTHSHIVLKYLGIIPESKIFYIDWSPKTLTSNVPTSHVSMLNNNPEARILALNKLGYDLHDFELFEAYLILEESSAEAIIRDFLIPNFVPGLYNRLRTIAARGVKDLESRVAEFERLFVFIHTSPVYKGKAWVIADGDKAGHECISTLKQKFKSWSENHFLNLSKPNFEEYYPPRFADKVNAIAHLKKQKKTEFKKSLITEVMNWSLKNRDQAIKEFEESASEIIEILKRIDMEINS